MYLPHETDVDELQDEIASSENVDITSKSRLWRILAGGLLITTLATAGWWLLRPSETDQVADNLHQPEQPASDTDTPDESTEDTPVAPGNEVFDRLASDDAYVVPTLPLASDSEFQLAEATASISDNEPSYVPAETGNAAVLPDDNSAPQYNLPVFPSTEQGADSSQLTVDATTTVLPSGDVDTQYRLSAETGGSVPADPEGGFAASEPLPFPSSTGLTDEVAATDPSSPDAPGRFQLEGNQTPSLSIHKQAPEEVQVNRTAVFTTTVKNVGKVAAHQVQVLDYVPRGTRFESSSPKSTQTVDGGLVWQLGTLQPGEEATVSMKIIPQREGEIGSVARVDFQAQASVRTISTRPQLVLHQSAAERVLVGEETTVSITLSNPGSGDAAGVVLETDIPTQLGHAAGRELEYPIGTLRAGETRQLKLKLTAASAGKAIHSLTAHGEGQLLARHDVSLEVIAPQLKVGVQGPRLRYLDRPATHAIQVINSGTASAHNVSLMMQLPAGLKFVSADHHGRYESRQHAVYWQLEELPANVQDAVKLTTMPVSAGEHTMRLSGNAELGVVDHYEHVMRVESVPQLMFSIADQADPIEQGSDTTYVVRVVNKGTRTATNVVVATLLPAQMQAIDGDGPTDARIDNGQIVFAPLDRLAPKAEATYTLQIRGVQPGDHVVRVQVASDDTRVPVSKEESTRVYADN